MFMCFGLLANYSINVVTIVKLEYVIFQICCYQTSCNTDSYSSSSRSPGRVFSTYWRKRVSCAYLWDVTGLYGFPTASGYRVPLKVAQCSFRSTTATISAWFCILSILLTYWSCKLTPMAWFFLSFYSEKANHLRITSYHHHQLQTSSNCETTVFIFTRKLVQSCQQATIFHNL